MFDSQFAKVVYSEDIAFAITTRTDAAGAQGVIEVMKEKNGMQSWYEDCMDKIIQDESKAKKLDGEPKMVEMPHGYFGGSVTEHCPAIKSASAEYNTIVAEPMIGAFRGRNPENPNERGKSNGQYKQRLELNENQTSNTITSVQKDNVVVEPVVLGWTRDSKGNVIDRHPVEVANCVTAAKRDNTQNYVVKPMMMQKVGDRANPSISIKNTAFTINANPMSDRQQVVVIPANTKEETIECEIGGVMDIAYPNSTTRRGRVQEGGTVSPALTCGCENSLARVEPQYRIRKLTERECFRLQGVQDEDSDKIRAVVSKSQCYKLAGNSIVVDNLLVIFENLFIGNQNKVQQLELF